MNSKKLNAYGQEFEDDDGDGGTVSKKPTAIQDQIVTDEKGKRRFHGAFTGGFSAGYWNTVGSKQGWVPQEFSSSRDSRGDKVQQRAEDFMDDEDLGEFGIGSRQIKRTATFGDSSKRKLAWERDSTSVSTITSMLDSVVKPVSDSIGAKMLRAMGWREGRGIGLANVKSKKNRGGTSAEAEFDREQAKKVAPAHELGQEDVLVRQLTPLTGVHGIGYEGLRHTTVLDEKYGQVASSLKTKKKGKGISGQAFGVGVFEEDDESVYSQFDMAQFDYSLDVTGRGREIEQAKKVDATFELQPKRQNARKFYAPPRLPPNFKCEHKPLPLDASKLPTGMQADMRNMTAVQRAKFLGEDRISTLELASSSKGGPRAERRSRWDIKADGGAVDEERERTIRNRVEFTDEPMKQARFKEFLHYLRRGLPYPQPTDLSVWEWESEKKEFEEKLTSEERAMLPEVRSRAQPLAKTAIAAPIHEILQSKFVKEAGGELQVGRKDEDKLAAVKMEMFGNMTRMSHEWYPHHSLARLFNVPHPYPGAEMVGVPHLQRAVRKETVINLGLPNTANELQMRERTKDDRSRRDEKVKKEVDVDGAEEQKENEDSSDDEKEVVPAEKAPKSFFDYVFGDAETSDSDDDSEDEEEKEKKKEERRLAEMKRRREEANKKREEEEEASTSTNKTVKTEVIDEEVTVIYDDDDIQVVGDSKAELRADASSYGPTVPENFSGGLSAFSVLKYLQDDLKKRREEKKERKHKKEGKEKKHSKKSKKEKKSKSEKKSHKKDKKKERRRSPSTSSDSSDWEEGR